VTQLIDEFLQQQNNIGDREIFSLEVFNLQRTYSVLAGSTPRHGIKMQIGLREWATVDTPYRAYYGQMKIADVGNWAQYGKALFDRNIRFHQGNTDVNDALADTITKQPDHFWYFNNGITVICSTIEKTRLNGDSRDYGVFDCEGAYVVNGGQTVSVICETAKKDPKYLQSLDAKVTVRIISLDNCPEGFDTQIARATNTQNRIQNRDFASLDPTQQRLANEMLLDGGKRYAFKSGDEDPGRGATLGKLRRPLHAQWARSTWRFRPSAKSVASGPIYKSNHIPRSSMIDCRRAICGAPFRFSELSVTS
jgi:hypothetical protein